MEKLIIREIMKVIFLVVGPLIIVSLFLLDKPLELGIAFITGVLLGVLRLKALFRYIICTLDNGKSSKNKISLVKYLANLFFALAAIALVLLKSVTIGLAVLLGLLTVPIIVMFYSMAKGLSIFGKK